VTEAFTYSIVRLPDDPMMPRFFDRRVGYFVTPKSDYGSKEQRVVETDYIKRWRLECSDKKEGNLCVPKKPITYYVDPATPSYLKPFIRAGIEEWQAAFEAAGFAKGIVAGEAPANDPDFSGEDASVTMVRWLPSPTANAQGPSLVDPRTGEILDIGQRCLIDPGGRLAVLLAMEGFVKVIPSGEGGAWGAVDPDRISLLGTEKVAIKIRNVF
jgi:hypothetical protein